MEIDLEKYKTCRMCEECDPEYAFCCKPLIAHIERLEAELQNSREKWSEMEIQFCKEAEERENVIENIRSTLASYKAVVEKMREALKHKTYRGDGIYRIQVEWIDAVDRALQAAEEEE